MIGEQDNEQEREEGGGRAIPLDLGPQGGTGLHPEVLKKVKWRQGRHEGTRPPDLERKGTRE